MISDKLRTYRLQAEMTQKDFVKELAKYDVIVSCQSISKYETGITRPSTETLIVIAKVLNKKVSDFLEDSNELFVGKVLDQLIKDGRIKDPNNIPKNLLDMLVSAIIEDVKSRIKKE